MAAFKENIIGRLDPVCGLQIDASKAKFQSTFEETTYYFCPKNCKDRFEEEPAKYDGDSNNRED